MADKMYVIITLRKEIEDRVEGRAVFDLVKQRLEDKPNITVRGLCSNHFETYE